MEKKQTPVEWLFQQLWETPKDKLNWYAIRSKALQMEQDEDLKEQETTLEESAKRILDRNEVADEDMILSCTFPNTIKAMIEMAKWQQERMYSEEEVITLLQQYRYDLSLGNTPNIGDTTRFWFEQVKKK